VKVLVVEDDDTLRSLWVDVFEGAGHEVMDAADAKHARSCLRKRPCDVAVLDLNLGDETGLSVATLASYVNPDCKIVMITGSQLFANGELFNIAPAISTVLRKPVGVEEILAVSEYQRA